MIKAGMFSQFLQAYRLKDVLQTALVQNKAEFIKLLIRHVPLDNFVSERQFGELYKRVPKNDLLFRLLEKQKSTVTLVFFSIALLYLHLLQ